MPPRVAIGAAPARRSPGRHVTSTGTRLHASPQLKDDARRWRRSRDHRERWRVTKGRDNSWQGAVDGLRINGTVFDFEETGVFERAA